jgi:outer membrane protein assembly factor BamB
MKRLLPLLALALGLSAGDARAANWSFWRGPEQNGVSREKDLPDAWSPDPKAADNNLVWSAHYGGITTPIVQNGRVYFIGPVGDDNLHLQERVVCLDADNGKLLKEFKFNVFHTDIVKDRLGWTTVVGDPETGNVYAQGVQGLLYCFDKDLKVVWQHSLTEEYGRISGYGGRVTSPVVDEDLVIVSMLNASWGYQGMGRCRFVAFDKKTGKVVWWSSTGFPPKDTYYSIPVVAVIGGQRLLISGGGDGGVHAFKVRTGEKVWSLLIGAGAVNCSPVVSGNKVFIGHGETNLVGSSQGSVVCVDGSEVKDGQPKLVWRRDGIRAKFASPIIDKDRLYICNETADLYCLNATDGKDVWTDLPGRKKVFQYGKNAKGSPLLADGKIYVGDVDGGFHILKPGDKDCKELHTQQFEGTEINGSPVAVNGRVYFMTNDDIYCIGKHRHNTKPGAIPPQPKEADGGKKATHLQVVPADVVLSPGGSAEFAVRSFNDKGQLIGEAKGEWTLEGMRVPEGAPPPQPGAQPPPAIKGQLSAASGATTKFTADKAPPGQFGRVVVKVGELTGEARVRVAPTLPLAADFSKVPEGRTPGGWVNTQGKFAVVKEGDKSVLKKTATNASPLVARANAYIGTPNLTDYTIQADVMAKKVRDDMADAGVVANRYTLVLIGNTQTLRLISWDAIPRVDKTIAYPWKPGEWYTLKLTCEVQGDKAHVRGKVWERGQAEPKEWTVEFTDPLPNREGAPALFANATGILQGQTGAEAFFDNVKITPNKSAETKPEK